MSRYLILWSIGICWIACRSTPAAVPVGDVAPGRLHFSDTLLTVCDSLRIPATVGDTARAVLVWQDAFGQRLLAARQDASGTYFLADSLLTQHAGKVDLVLVEKQNPTATHTLHLRPASPSGLVETYAGAKTMVVNSRQTAMIIGVPKDRYGNPTAARTRTTFSLRYPGEAPRAVHGFTNNLVAAVELPTGPRTGKLLSGVAAGAARSIEEAIELTPGIPAGVTLHLENAFRFADERQEIVVRTDPMTDAFGNPVADGTLVDFLLHHRDTLRGRYRAFATGGVARVRMPNPTRAGRWWVRAQVPGSPPSAPLALDFAPYVTELPLRYAAGSLRIGPVAADLGQVVTDDLPVRVRLSGAATDLHLTGNTEDGYVRLELPDALAAGPYLATAEAGGLRRTLRFTLQKPAR